MKACERWESMGPVSACITCGLTQTGPGLKKRTWPGEPAVESKFVIRGILRGKKERKKLFEIFDDCVRRARFELYSCRAAARKCDDGELRRPCRRDVDRHVAHEHRFARRDRERGERHEHHVRQLLRRVCPDGKQRPVSSPS